MKTTVSLLLIILPIIVQTKLRADEPLSPPATKASEKQPATPKGQGRKEVYIPKDLEDCFAELTKMLSKEEVEKMKNGSEDQMIHYHHGLGMWLRNNWGLWKGSRLKTWFKEKGIQHPDDMSGIIFDSFWRHLNDKPINLDEQIKVYQDYWKKTEEEQESPNSN